MSPFLFSDFTIFRVFSPKTISVLKIVEPSMISMLDYLRDTLANVGLTGAQLEWDLNDVTWIKNNYIKRESNRI